MRIVLKRARHFITCKGKFYGSENISNVRTMLMLEEKSEKYEQLSMFSTPELSLSALTGQL